MNTVPPPNEGASHADIARQYSESSARINEELDRQRSDKKGKKGHGKTEGDDLKSELEMWEHRVTVAELCEKLGTDELKGLGSTEAQERLKKDGPNVLSPPKVTPWYIKLFLQFTNFFAILLQVASILSFIGFALTPENRDNLYLGCVLYGVVIITALFTFFQEFSSEKTMEKFSNFLPPQTLAVRDGRTAEIAASELVVGDVVNVKLGDKIPADLRLVENSKLKVEMASLTGESEPLGRTVECTDENPLETKNLVFFGTHAVEGTARGIVVNTGDRTVFGRIAGLAASSETVRTTLQIEIHHFVVLISSVAITLGILFLVFGFIRSTEPIENIVLAISIIVANVPEGLLATVTVSLTLTAKRMATRNVLVKKLESVETLGSTTTICSDKTGTLTQNRMTVLHLMYDGVMHSAKTSTTESDLDEDDPVFRSLFLNAACCAKAVFDAADLENNPDLPVDERKVNGDASESGILKFAEKLHPVMPIRERNPQVSGIPFNSTNKFMVTIHRDEQRPGQHRLLMKGAPERVITRCTRILTGDSGVRDITEADRDNINRNLETMMGNGERVLGFAERIMPAKFAEGYEFDNEKEEFLDEVLENELCFVGLISLLDPPRESVPNAVKTCQTAGIQVIMVTGDHPATAKSIAKAVNIIRDPTAEDLAKERGVALEDIDESEAKSIVVPGWTIKDLDEADWDRILAKDQIVFARTSPQQKLIIVENCQRLGKIVAVTGDGVNDSPALKKANIGVAMGIAGSDVSKEAADMILLDDNFSSIVSGVEEGRLIFDNLKKSISYTLTSNIPELIPFILFIIISIPLPLTTILILCIDLGTDMVPAISLAYERAENDIMKRRPRKAGTDRLVNRKLIGFAYLQIGVMQALAGLFAFFVVMNDYGLSAQTLPFLDRESYYGAKEPENQRWLAIQRPSGNSSAVDTAWFDQNEEFSRYFEDSPPAGFIQQTTALFSELSSAPGDVGIEALNGLAPGDEQFNNMVKILGTELGTQPCLQYACQVGADLVVDDDRCFGPDNAGPVYYAGVNTGVHNTALGDDEACFDVWTVEQQDLTLEHAQSAFFVAIIVVQWGDLLICKTRSRSLFQQGMWNWVLNFGLVLETALAVFLLYVPPIQTGFGTAPIIFLHWLPGLPFTLLEFVYDETRKFFIRRYNKNPNFRLGRFLSEFTYW
eukprot:CAMPEP_0198729596 /NCGR_PEP_ID=MMETSP1475-20131203/19920_1 /TAXON_ID= ORGANISM="Unidentified sp., Strain CCMP1999" /NCGR_SAMPLE_ID=MMETSP1475 /ASSEMBLY_ACC=CAM_ASM_001111 /LENGTH=1175 /DNA_ID=CAMNT_0044492289 /DNA_START=147 /DNA_END=3674 /DNA_ORIENTATION=-